jgi:hypothetical protein
MQRSVLLSLTLAVLLAQPSLAQDLREVSWAELVPAPVDYENPFDGLSGEQLDDLRRLVRLQSRVETSYFMQPALVEPYR